MENLDDLWKIDDLETLWEKHVIAAFQRLWREAVLAWNDNVPSLICKGLYLGSLGASHNTEELERLKITHVLAVAEGVDCAYPQLFTYKHIPYPDHTYAGFSSIFDECFAFIDEARDAGGAVLVHCFAGRSRSPTLVTAYLMRTHDLPLSKALASVREERRIKLHPEFVRQLGEYDRGLCQLRALAKGGLCEAGLKVEAEGEADLKLEAKEELCEANLKLEAEDIADHLNLKAKDEKMDSDQVYCSSFFSTIFPSLFKWS